MNMNFLKSFQRQKILKTLAFVSGVSLFATVNTVLYHRYRLSKEKLMVKAPGEMVAMRDGRKVFVHQSNKGQKNVVVIINGFAANYLLVKKWQTLLQERLGDAWNVVIYDRSGYGFSDPYTTYPTSFSELAVELDEFLPSCIPKDCNVSLLCASMGGLIGYNVVNNHLESNGSNHYHIQSLVCVDPPFLKDCKEINNGMALMGGFVKQIKHLWEWGFMRWFWIFGLFPATPPQNLIPEKEKEYHSADVWKYLSARKGGHFSTWNNEGTMMQCADWSLEEKILQNVRDSSVPLCFLLHDHWMPGMQESYHKEWKERALYLQNMLGQENVTILQDTNHVYYVENPEQLVQLVFNFLLGGKNKNTSSCSGKHDE